MFTGIIQGPGLVTLIRADNHERRFRIRPLFHMEDIVDGESIAINGVCLSVENHNDSEFSVYASAETTKASTLGKIGQGAEVNLERALKVGERLGGHMVSGHVDCVATVTLAEKTGQSLRIGARFPARFAPQVVAKGSVALDGISLTVNNCGADFLEVNIIPDSQKRTNIRRWRRGTEINMETDIIGKYVQHLAAPWHAMDRGFLAENGFI